MATYKKRPDFFTSEEGIQIFEELNAMLLNDLFITEPGFSSDINQYPDHVIPFVDKHMCYLRDHPNTDPRQYLSNLKLMTRISRIAS